MACARNPSAPPKSAIRQFAGICRSRGSRPVSISRCAMAASLKNGNSAATEVCCRTSRAQPGARRRNADGPLSSLAMLDCSLGTHCDALDTQLRDPPFHHPAVLAIRLEHQGAIGTAKNSADAALTHEFLDLPAEIGCRAFRLGGRPWMRHVCQQHDSRTFSEMPDLVFEAVVEDQAFAFFPFKRPIFDPNEGVLWSLDTKMDAQPLVAETAVGRQMRAGAQARQHDHTGAPYGLRQPFDDGGRHRKPRRAARDPNTGLVEHDLIPG